jgi:hypothetical protein
VSELHHPQTNTFCPAELLVNHFYTLVKTSIYLNELQKHALLKDPQDKKHDETLSHKAVSCLYREIDFRVVEHPWLKLLSIRNWSHFATPTRFRSQARPPD